MMPCCSRLRDLNRLARRATRHRTLLRKKPFSAAAPNLRSGRGHGTRIDASRQPRTALFFDLLSGVRFIRQEGLRRWGFCFLPGRRFAVAVAPPQAEVPCCFTAFGRNALFTSKFRSPRSTAQPMRANLLAKATMVRASPLRAIKASSHRLNASSRRSAQRSTVRRAVDQQGAQLAVAVPRDPHQGDFAAGAVLFRHDSQPGGYIPSVLELLAIADGSNKGRRHYRPKARHAQQTRVGEALAALAQRSAGPGLQGAYRAYGCPSARRAMRSVRHAQAPCPHLQAPAADLP